MEENDLLTQIYYDPQNPAGYGGANALARVSGVKLKKVQEWLKGQSAYTLHKPARKRNTTRPYRTSGIHHLWQADLADMQPYANQNDGYRYILCVIDVFSRKAWAQGIKSKRAPDVQAAFDVIFNDANATPMAIQTDQGFEFESAAMRPYFRARNIKQYSVKSQFKASVVERFNRTLKTKMWRYFTYRRTRRWIDVLQNLLSAYNNAYHRSVKMSPNNITHNNEMLVWLRAEEQHDAAPSTKLKGRIRVGDSVRISKVKRTFDKGYLPYWTTEIFTVNRILNTKLPSISSPL